MSNWIESIYSDGTINFVSNPTPKINDKITIKIRLYKDSPVEGVFFRFITNGEIMTLPMEKNHDDKIFQYYKIDIKVKQHKLSYRFLITTKDEVYYYNSLNVTNYDPVQANDFVILANLDYPEWIKKTVFYQIFPDRFCNGDKSLNPKEGEYEVNGFKTKVYKEWDTIPLSYKDAGCMDHYGGDLVGIESKISYFKDLGVNALYINPIFKGMSHHKYDCIDYYEVDPHFGGNGALANLTDELHKNNMKIMLDISVNHTGTGHKWMNREGYFSKDTGAFNNKESEYRDFYYYDEDKKDFHRWMGTDTLVSLDYRNEKVRDIIYKNDDSVLQTYLKEPYNIDAWRLDVANNMTKNNEVDESSSVWPELRKSLKSVKKDCYIIGEHWSDCSEYINEPKWDAAMNYFGFSRPVRSFFGDIDIYLQRIKYSKDKSGDAKRLKAQLLQQLGQCPTCINLIQFNAIDTHDIYRFHSLSNVDYDKARGAIIMLFTIPGAPSIYYGDEVGIEGDMRYGEGCRYPMVWNKEKINYNYFNLYSSLAHLRQKSDVLSDGGFKVLYAEKSTVAYARFNLNQAFIVISSQENENREVSIDAKVIGVNSKSKISEYFDNGINFENNDGIIKINVPVNKTVLLNVKINL